MTEGLLKRLHHHLISSVKTIIARSAPKVQRFDRRNSWSCSVSLKERQDERDQQHCGHELDAEHEHVHQKH